MTDERIGERLWEAIDALPDGGGIVFRHYGLPPEERLALGQEIAWAAKRRDLLLAVAGCVRLADRLGAELVHNPDGPSLLPISMAVHDRREAIAARLAGASLAFVAPVHPTSSHPGAATLGAETALELAQLAGCPAIALGGMDAAGFDELQQVTSGGFHGYAGIDCWLRQ